MRRRYLRFEPWRLLGATMFAAIMLTMPVVARWIPDEWKIVAIVPAVAFMAAAMVLMFYQGPERKV